MPYDVSTQLCRSSDWQKAGVDLVTGIQAPWLASPEAVCWQMSQRLALFCSVEYTGSNIYRFCRLLSLLSLGFGLSLSAFHNRSYVLYTNKSSIEDLCSRPPSNATLQLESRHPLPRFSPACPLFPQLPLLLAPASLSRSLSLAHTPLATK